MPSAHNENRATDRAVAGGTFRVHVSHQGTAMLNNRNLLKGLFLIIIALAFGLGALKYPLGSFDRAGPGLFPLLISSLVFLLGLITLIRAFLVDRVPMAFSVRNIGLILGSLIGFALISEYVNMILGIIFMVFVAALAGTNYSVMRNVKVSAGLIAMAFVFWKALGVQLPLY